ncbi:initiator tRNA phosphoribosyl transferase [Rhizopus microsporus ATCC 52813]|uniref:Initiator tRNA phosphoribosyl transferase n=1 Tax=Rhizopus microsporus ATCC 52813 TaxID=1340429 RepID=A0A2G4SVK9_RHIZD|nr:initiator tRNA phosphoribosyl transferase [Rhizopus microsporus ATCC 52813]PHZ12809.1 initiator tRNA phosphoribosyl transferase [Rhizopus microsporus ATCC 52813]
MEIFLYEKSDFNQEANQVRKDAKNIYNRLRSIVDDASFVMTISDLFPRLALVANERCGSWYIDRRKKQAYSAYFKSTDGHMHIWDFNIRRNNLHLIPIIAQHHGCILVDSTRKGKRIPDALSKTIPIWCCTINRAVQRIKGYHWDTDFHSLPSAVSRSEHAQIEAKMESLVDKLMSSGIDVYAIADQLKKPLRPIWFTPQSCDTIVPDFDDCSFWPVVCLSASEAVENGYQARPGYLYVQGSGDDQEAWCLGLTPSLFWENHQLILESKGECERRVIEIVKDSLEKMNSQTTGSFAFIKPTTIAISDLASAQSNWQQFDVIINCSEKNLELNSDTYLHLPIPEGKRGQQAFLLAIPKAIRFVEKPLLEKQNILICCDSGKDSSVGIALSILVNYFDLDGQLQKEAKPRVDKKVIQHQLVRIISSWEKASPSRTTLKKVNVYFMSHSNTTD